MDDSNSFINSLQTPYMVLTTTVSSMKVFDPLLKDKFIIHPSNESDSFIVEEVPHHRKATIIIEGIIIPILATFGVVGNVASIIHFGSNLRRMNHFQAYMFYLGIVDLFLIILSLFLQSASELSFVHLLFNHDYYRRVQVPGRVESEKNVEDCRDEVTKMSEQENYLRFHSFLNQFKVYMLPIYSILISMNICIHVVISVERYLVITRPFYSIKCKKYQPWIVVIAITVFASFYNSTKFFEHRLVYTELELPDDHIQTCEEFDKWFSNKKFQFTEICSTDLRRNQIYIFLMSSLSFLSMSLIPYVTILVINVLILRRLIEHREWTTECHQHDIELQENSLGVPGALSIAATIAPLRSLRRQSTMPQIHLHSNRRRRNEVLLAKLSLIIMVPYLLYHTVRIVPNVYELSKGYEPMVEGASCRIPIGEKTEQSMTTERNDEYVDIDVQEPNQHGWIYVVIAISNCLMIVNSSINFYIYYGKYRKHLPQSKWICSRFGERTLSQPPPISLTRLSMMPNESRSEGRSIRQNFD